MPTETKYCEVGGLPYKFFKNVPTVYKSINCDRPKVILKVV